MKPKTQALLSAVLPQDLFVKNVTKWSDDAAARRLREGRLVGRLALLGFIAGGTSAHFVGYGISAGIVVGGLLGVVCSWCIVGLRRRV